MHFMMRCMQLCMHCLWCIAFFCLFVLFSFQLEWVLIVLIWFWAVSHAINTTKVMVIVNGGIKFVSHCITQAISFIDSVLLWCLFHSKWYVFPTKKIYTWILFPLWICAKELRRGPCFHTAPMNSWKWISSHDNKLSLYTIKSVPSILCLFLCITTFLTEEKFRVFS